MYKVFLILKRFLIRITYEIIWRIITRIRDLIDL